jgi:arylsulfatase A-like enzyme
MATIDFLPTFAAMTAAKVPGDRVIDGVNQLECIMGSTSSARSTYLYNPGSASVGIVQGNAIREGDWKLISPLTVGRFLEDAGSGEWELYHLKEDIGETQNLAAKYPGKVNALRKKLEQAESDMTP